MNKEIRAYNTALEKEDTKIATLLMKEIDAVFTSDKLSPRAALGK